MKNFIIAVLAAVYMLGSCAYAQTSDDEFKARNSQQLALQAQESTEKACDNAIKETESYDDSVQAHLNALEAFTLGSKTFARGDFIDSKKQFDLAITQFEIAQDFCTESRQLQLSQKGYDSAFTQNIVMRLGDGLRNSNESQLSQIFRGDLLRTINRIIGALAILYLVFIGVKYILAMGDSDKMSSYKSQAAWLILGLVVVSLAEFAGFELLDPSGGKDILTGETEVKLMDKVSQVIRYFEFAAGAFMLLNAILAGYHLIMSGEKDETISQEKAFLKSLLLGSGFILMAEVIVRVLSFQDSPAQTTQIFVSEVAGVVNFALSFVAILAMSMLVLASLYYVISFGDDDQTNRAKRMIKTSIIGVIISSASYVLVRFLI